MPPKLPQFVTAADLARALRCSVKTVRRRVGEYGFPVPLRQLRGRPWLFDYDEVRAYLLGLRDSFGPQSLAE